jgi:hypothetical protein
LYGATAKTVRTFLIAQTQTLDFIASSLFALDDLDRTSCERYSSIAPLDLEAIVPRNRKNDKNYHLGASFWRIYKDRLYHRPCDYWDKKPCQKLIFEPISTNRTLLFHPIPNHCSQILLLLGVLSRSPPIRQTLRQGFPNSQKKTGKQ